MGMWRWSQGSQYSAQESQVLHSGRLGEPLAAGQEGNAEDGGDINLAGAAEGCHTAQPSHNGVYSRSPSQSPNNQKTF